MNQIEKSINQYQRVLLVWAYTGDTDIDSVINELKSLVDTAGGEVIDVIIQNRNTVDPFTVVGSGKLQEIAQYAESLNIDVVIFENELNPSQIKNIQEVIECKVIDRTALILDIFALHAVTAEGKLQVELAQLRYNLPRLMGSQTQLSRLGGGIGTRGPGETKLETDRRYIKRRITNLEKQINDLSEQRDDLRKRRKKNQMPCVAIVGYTNAGKSSLINKLTNSEIYVANMLFATLDPSARRMEFDNGTAVIVIDTVGFIRNIPTGLVAAFKSTLEEAVFADLILNVCDISNPEMQLQCDVTLKTLEELKCNAPIITVYNKSDLIDENTIISAFSTDKLLVSAKNGFGIENLKARINNTLFGDSIYCKIFIPYTDSKSNSDLKAKSKIISEEFLDNGTLFKCNIVQAYLSDFSDYIIK
ncbi:MAG: GTPase HflX [Clostridia bacterium]